MTISKLQLMYEGAVKWTFSDEWSIEECLATYVMNYLPIFEALTLINSSDSFLFLEPTLLRSQEYLSKNI